EEENRTKIIKECGLVFPKVLKDILVDLARKVVPGFIYSGAVLTKTRLDCPKGYTCR
ncbi:24377_t:CDS:2, partial [Gigaspora rosea]